ncbi:Phosphatidylethanolamine N-methyltransferase [Porphyridium purpureum]|uniref:Phosphatidylethanolamine N-methyltransferase n=1 Tax=Porphyridium purpureum TaxID=35688 RepID=A0A5J4YJ34_PORPP|nr:Phosphatidylethanolamine N-methyltransferase [Porphyridium purpureum]KAA8495317.1 Phosphatidylethanolamine N-methyltransferase [Porphyridium purpureum]|eukprot:POR0938..scf209_3
MLYQGHIVFRRGEGAVCERRVVSKTPNLSMQDTPTPPSMVAHIADRVPTTSAPAPMDAHVAPTAHASVNGKHAQRCAAHEGERQPAQVGGRTGAKKVKTGRVADGTTFVVPETKSMFDALLKPRNWGIAEVLVNLVMWYHVALALAMRHVPLWVYVAHFAFWRLSYNLGLGLILNRQSRTRFITEWVRQASPDRALLMKRLVKSSMGNEYSWSKMPVEFNAWLLFRMLSMLILANDGLSYVILCIKLFNPLDENPFILLVCLTTGLGLLAFSLWSKTSAHDCVGDFAWYWGDFFFIMQGELKFDGVFEMFPHPMYTVGYAAYYGFAVLCRSSSLLIVSLLAHLGQILFLVYCEEPHIQKIYGPSQQELKQLEMNRLAARLGHAPEALGFKFLDLFRPTDFALVYSVAVQILLALFTSLGLAWHTTHLMLWRLFHFVCLSLILHLQSRQQWWMKRFIAKGYTETEAYAFWKRLFNFSTVMNHVSFVIFACKIATPKLASLSWSTIFSASIMATMSLGCTLIAFSMYIVTSAAEALGPESWFYGDFFLDLDGKTEPKYDGIYRYLNNPDCVLGFLGHYGVALLTRSWRVFWVALFSNLAMYIFVHLVEVPHMERKYRGLRDATALERQVRNSKIVSAVSDSPVIRKVTSKLRSRAVQGQTRLGHDLKETAQGLHERVEKLRKDITEDLQRLKADLTQHRLILKTAELKDSAAYRMQRADSELLALLRRSTFTREYLDMCISDDEDSSIQSGGRSSSSKSVPEADESISASLPTED